MNRIKQQRLDIAASIFACPCTEEELLKRDFLKNKSIEITLRFVFHLENDGAIFYKGEVMHIKRKWAKENLKEYDFDFRTERDKYIDSLTPFAREVLGIKSKNQ